MESIIDIHHHLTENDLREVSGRRALLDVGKDYEIICRYPELNFSVGIHPWETADSEIAPAELFGKIIEIARLPQVAAIGECGIDLLKGGAMFRQLQLFRRHVELSEETGKPLIIHDVKADDIILGLHRDLHPSQKWAIHGFRGKPGAAKMLIAAGCYLSFGEKFNADTLRMTPPERILAETDESTLSIEDIISRLSEACDTDLRPQIVRNTLEFLIRDSSKKGLKRRKRIE